MRAGDQHPYYHMKKLNIISTIFRFLQGSIFFYLALLLNEMHFSGWEAGILLSMYLFTPILVSLPAGLLNDKVSSRVLISSSFIGLAIFYSGLSRIHGFLPLAIIFIVGGASVNLATVSLQALALKIIGREEKATRLGRFNGFSMVGYAAGLLSGGCLMGSGLLMGLLSYSALIFVLLALYSLTLAESTIVSINLLEYIEDFKHKNVVWFCFIYAIFAFHWGAETSSLSLFLRDHFHLTKIGTGIYLCIPIFCLGISSFFTGLLIDRRGVSLKSLFLVAVLMSGFGQLLMVVHNIYLSDAVRVIHDIGDGIVGVLFMVILTEFFKKERIGGLSSMVTFSAIISQSVGTLFFSRIGEDFGQQYSIILGSVSIFVAFILMWMNRNSLGEHQESKSESRGMAAVLPSGVRLKES